MPSPVKYNITEIIQNNVICEDSAGQKKTVGINSIVHKRKRVTIEDISISDQIELVYIKGKLVKTELIKSDYSEPFAPADQQEKYLDSNLNPGLYSAPNPFGFSDQPEEIKMQPRESIYFTREESKLFQEPTPTFQIGAIQPLASAPFNHEFSRSTLSPLFSTFRKIKPGISNLTLAFIVGLFDHCILYNKIEVFYTIKTTLSTHTLQLLNPLDEMIQVIQQIEETINSSYSNKEKLDIIQNVYETYINELELIVKNLIKIQAELMHYRKEYELLGALRPLGDVINACNSGIFESYDFVYLLNLCKMQMRIIDAKDMTIVSQGSKCEHIFYMLQMENNDYCTLYTKHEYYLQTYQREESLEMLKFMTEMRNAEFNEKITSLNHMDLSIKDLSKKTSDIIQLLKDLCTISGSDQNLESVKKIVQDSSLNEALTEACCVWCKKFVTTAEFPCGHLLCINCSYNIYTEYYCSCCICNLYTERNIIDSQFRNY